ncbi:nuclear transport factor 2 family protein [Dyella japonica]|uniref:Ketosteroid isomerase-like protein n=1 Tax=Dyella japonica TaxID=231455 RepID=A0ABV2JWG5_9GAMM
MMLDLPTPIRAYFAADAGNDADALARTFVEDAVVVDEGHTYQGRAEIKQWNVESSAKYEYTSEPIAVAKTDDKFIVTSRLVGKFKGSPIDLQYGFELQGDKIASLEIGP